MPVAAGQAVHGAAAPRRCGLGEAAGFTELPKQKNRMRVQAGILAWVAMLVVAGYSCTRIMEAGDTWVALACGRHIVNHGVVTADPFSFNSLKPGPTDEQLERFSAWTRPLIKKLHPTGWVNQNWLTHVSFYALAKAFDSGGGGYDFNVLVVWKFCVTFLSAVCVFYIGRVMGAGTLISAIAACCAVFVGRTFNDIRPALLTDLMAAAYLLALQLAVYRSIRYIWLIVPLIVVWSNAHGGYIYAFIMLAPFAAAHLAAAPFKKQCISMDFKALRHTIAAGATALIAAAVCNPYHLTNFTHTLEVSLSSNAAGWRSVNEWHPAFEWSNRVGDAHPFLYMFIVMWVAPVVWGIAYMLLRRVCAACPGSPDGPAAKAARCRPAIDPAYIAVAGLTVFMAVQSRRFIPLAAVAMCPLVAVFLHQAAGMLAAAMRRPANGRASHIATATLAAGLFFITVFWAVQLKKMYIDPWPDDDTSNSVFKRMTMANSKPFDACRFIRDNHVSGRMFNYWTDGGAIAFGQEPDPATGDIALKFFIDGRAQAAFDYDRFQLWQHIMNGGPAAEAIKKAGRQPASADLTSIGSWIDEQLKSRDISVVLMPARKTTVVFIAALETRSNWRVAYMDDLHVLLADTGTPQGRRLLDDILNHRAHFPSEFSQQLTLAMNLLKDTDSGRIAQGFSSAQKAFMLDKSGASMQMLAFCSLWQPSLKQQANALITGYMDDFKRNKQQYAAESGYRKKLAAAIMAAGYLAGQSPDYKNLYEALTKEYELISEQFSW